MIKFNYTMTFISVLSVFWTCPVFSEVSELKIAYIGGLTGRESQSSVKSLKALELIASEFNNRGGLLGKRINIVPFDNESIAFKNVEIINKILNSEIKAIVGLHISNDALLIADVAEKNHIPLIIASATNPDISKGKKYVFQVCATDDRIGKVLSDFVRKQLNIRQIAVVTDVSDSASISVGSWFSKEFVSSGGKILHEFKIRKNLQNFDNIIQKLKALNDLEATMISAPAIESSYLIRKMYDSGLRLPVIGTDNWQNQDLGLALKMLDNPKVRAFFPGHWYYGLQNSASRRFIRFFKGILNTLDADPALTYDSGLILFSAIIQAKSLKSDDIIKELKKIKVKGVTGDFGFDHNGISTKSVYMLMFKDGEIVPAVSTFVKR